MSSPPPYALWASADDWKPGFVMLGSNVSTILTAPPQSEVIIGADGLWGVHKWMVYPQLHHPEFPYLTWIPLHSPNSSFSSNILTRSIDKLMWQVHSNKSNIHSVHRDVLDELTVKWRLTKAALEDPFSTISFDHTSVCLFWNSMHFWTGGRIIALVTIFALPFVHQLEAPFLRITGAARGYAECLDTFNPMKGFKCKMDKMKNKVNDEACHMAKKAKTDLASELNNQELRHLTDAGATPDWFPKIQEVWKHAVGHVSHLGLASQESSCRFVLPPIHLFWGGEPPNQHVYYHHYLLLLNEIKNRPERDLPALTTHEWRAILGNSYWKKQWPKHDKNNSSTFDPNVFWKCGGPLLFRNEQSADVAAGCYNLTSWLSFRCDVQLAMADETDIHQVVLYYFNSFHVYEEIREMEHLQFLTTFEKRWQGLYLEVNQIMEMWDPSGGIVNTKFFCNKEVWIRWVWAVHDVVAGWGGFNPWDWGSFSKVRVMEIDNLSGLDFQRFTIHLLTFFIHLFVTHLDYYPSALLHPPTLAARSCISHLKKFGYQLVTLLISFE
ncbi:hypothetical protein EDB87DRAFT_1574675 [Lactarius vividus]|nr:hypothetical protein EDB87DRAFT_1574675 [Lactarius vividus]